MLGFINRDENSICPPLRGSNADVSSVYKPLQAQGSISNGHFFKSSSVHYFGIDKAYLHSSQSYSYKVASSVNTFGHKDS